MIEFRGKTDKGKWIYGTCQVLGLAEGKKRYTIVKLNGMVYGVEAATVGQYALAQPLGVKIFTGDILSERWRAEVYQDAVTGTFMVLLHGGRERKRMTLQDYLMKRALAGNDNEDHKIIGNIHDNPELLEVQP